VSTSQGWRRPGDSAVLELALDCIVVADHEGRIQEWNPASERTFGWRRDQVIGRELAETIVPERLRARHREGLARFLATGTARVIGRRIELPALRADGTEFPCEIAITTRVHDGRPMFTATLRDVSERQDADAALRDRAEAAALVSEISRVFLGADAAGIDAVVVDSLRRVAKFLGADRGSFAIVHDDQKAFERTHVWDERTAQPGVGPLPVRAYPWLFGQLGGSDITVAPEMSRLPAEAKRERASLESYGVRSAVWIPARTEGVVRGFIAFWWRETGSASTPARLAPFVILGDVIMGALRRTRAEEALRGAQQALEWVTSAIPGVVYQSRRMPDGSRQIPYISARAIDLFEHPAEAFVADPELPWRMVVPEDHPSLLQSQRESDEALAPWTAEWRVRTPAGAVKWIRGTAALEKLTDGTIVRNGILLDITAQRRLEMQVHQSDRLSSLGTLAAGIAHEVNNPLASVVANLSYGIDTSTLGSLGRPIDWSELERALSEAMDGARRVRDIVAALKSFSRIDADDSGPCDANAAVDVAVRLTRNEIRHRARLVVDRGEIPPVRASEPKLVQVFVNLLVNAAQAIAPRSAEDNEIRVSTRRQGDRVVCEVWDNGVGIPKDALGRIFDPFYTTKPVGVGTGLGLSICHGIVTRLGGEMEVESEPGFGTMLRISLECAAPIVEPAAAPVPARQSGGGSRILLVDDEPLVLSAIERVLSDHDVVRAASAAEALEQIERGGSFDAVLCDLMMPGTTGAQLHGEVERTQPALAGRFLFLTGGAFAPDMAEFAQRMAGRILEKPVDPRMLRERLARIVG